MQDRFPRVQVAVASAALALLLFGVVAGAGPVTGIFLGGLDYSVTENGVELNDSTGSDTVRGALDGGVYRYRSCFYGFDLPTPPDSCDAFSIDVWTEVLGAESPTGVLTQVYALGSGELFSFTADTFWGQWGTYRVPPDTGLMRCGSTDTSIVDERNAFLLRRDRPNTVRFVVHIRAYTGDYEHRVDRVVLNWDARGTDAAAPRASPPSEWALGAAYPNPFNGAVTIPLDVGAQGHVTVDVINILGQRVAKLIDGQVSPGSTQLRWEPRDVGTGMYLVRMTGPSSVVTRRITYVR